MVECLDESNGEISPSMLEQIYLCRQALICEEKKNCECHWISYALLQIAGKEERSVYHKYYQKNFDINMELPLILCMIDSREVYLYEMNLSNEKKKYLEKCAEEYRKAIEEMGYSEEIKAVLWHHRGKALRRCHRFNEALESFRKAIELKPEYYSSYAQIAYLGSLKKNDRKIFEAGEKALNLLFDFCNQSINNIPLRVILLAIIKMRSYPKIKARIDSADVLVKKLGDMIIMSSIDRSGQFYDAFVSFTAAFGYHHAEKCISLMQKVPLIRSMNSSSIEKSQWISACESLANLMFSAKKIQNDAVVSFVKEITFSFTEDIVKKISDWNAYQVRVIAKAYNIMGYPQKTIDFLSKYLVVYKDNHWVLYRKAEAELALSKSESLETVRLAIEIACNDSYAQKMIASYYFLLAKCQEKFDSLESAIISIQEAIEKCEDDVYLKDLCKYKCVLESKLKDS